VVHEYYYDEDDDGSGASRWLKVLVVCLVGVFVVGAGFWLLRDDEGPPLAAGDLAPAGTEVAIGDSAAPSVAPVGGANGSSTSTSDAGGRGSSASTTTSATATTVSTTTDTATSVAVAPPPGSVEAPPVSTAAASAGGYPTAQDGTPLPILVTYDADTITMTGFVPSQEAKDRLGVLALANSKTEARLENNLVINPDVPIGVGVRVMELNSARFPEGSAELRPEHAREFERVATFMLAAPNVTALVIGHADQRGDEEGNYEISAERAEAVVDFLIYLGVSPTRLSSRAVGEADLLTLDDDETALALNRRTEFIFYGLLIE
jgi:outer membrane protein OmpA-like peptidoglycan-associated protein